MSSQTNTFRTNKVSVKFDYENIDRDFDIFQIRFDKSENKPDKRIQLLNEITSDVYAIQSYWGGFHLLFKKGCIKERVLRRQMEKINKGVAVKQMESEDMEDRDLVSLLCFSLYAINSGPYKKNNLLGELLYYDPNWNEDKYARVFLSICFTKDMHLEAQVKTFTKDTDESKEKRGVGAYAIDPESKELRKRREGDKDTYSFRSENGKHNVDYLSIRNIHTFERCKLGVINSFFSEVKEELRNYLTLTCEKKEFLPYKKEWFTPYDRTRFNKKVHIIDETGECAEDRALLIKLLGDAAEEGSVEKGCYSIRIIHEQEYYKNSGHDPHQDVFSGCLVQHITKENFLDTHRNDKKMLKEGDMKTLLETIKQEFLVKEDVLSNQISLFEWNKKEPWYFVIAKKDEKKFNTFHRICIHPDGTFETDIVPEDSKEAYYFDELFENKALEKLFYTDLDHIHAIMKTNERVTPNISAIKDELKRSDPKEKLNLEELYEWTDFFAIETGEDDPKINQLLNALKEKMSSGSVLIKKDDMRRLVNDTLGGRSNLGKKYFAFLADPENAGISLRAEIKGKDKYDTYQLNAYLGVWYRETEDGIEYYKGDKKNSPDQKNARSYPIREITGHDLTPEEILPLMTVDFVKNGDFTVIPFPFKYLREAHGLKW